jgi:two-component system, OmpR family, sensor histidine kinase VicK
MKLSLFIGGGVVVLSIFIGALVVLVRKSHKKVKSSANTVANLSSDLRSEREKSEIIINSIDDGVMLLDRDHMIRLFNPAASTITGWPTDEAIGIGYQNVLKFVNDKGEPVSSDSHPVEKGLLSVTTYRDNTSNIVTRSSKLVPMSISISPLFDKHNKPDGAVAIFRDVTNERTEEKQRAEFISTASHEMRTPVAAIEGYLSLALNEKVAHIDAKARDSSTKPTKAPSTSANYSKTY